MPKTQGAKSNNLERCTRLFDFAPSELLYLHCYIVGIFGNNTKH